MFSLSLFPLCSFDVRGRAFSKALYWSDTNAFGPRAYFLTVSKPATLSVDNVQLDDEGVSRSITQFACFSADPDNQQPVSTATPRMMRVLISVCFISLFAGLSL
jgi:hypothetical protein